MRTSQRLWAPVLGVFLLLAGFGGRAAAQGAQDHTYSAQEIDTGSRLYANQCASCHGPNGDQVAGVNLQLGEFRRALSDDDIRAVITSGVPAGGMPPFNLHVQELDGLVAFTPVPGAPEVGIGRRSPINNWTNEVGNGAVMAVDPHTGDEVWKFVQYDVTDSGILTTATDLLFTGGREGYFHALDARTGELLWKASLGGQIVMAPITYTVDGKQSVSVISGHALVTFGLRE